MLETAYFTVQLFCQTYLLSLDSSIVCFKVDNTSKPISLCVKKKGTIKDARYFATCLTQQTVSGFFKTEELLPQPQYIKENPSNFVGL